jgi:hypothetical protein
MPTTTLHDRLTELIRDHYVFPDVAEKIVADLDSTHPEGTAEQVATQLTQRLQSVNHDRHLRVRYRESGALEGTDWEVHYAADTIRNAGGMRRVERLDQRTGVLAIAPYMSPVHLAERYVTAAFALLAVKSICVVFEDGHCVIPRLCG